MSERGYGFLSTTCSKCGEPLLRIAESETNDRVYCPDCLLSGGYKEVIEEGGGLDNGMAISDELRDFIQKEWVAHKLGGE